MQWALFLLSHSLRGTLAAIGARGFYDSQPGAILAATHGSDGGGRRGPSAPRLAGAAGGSRVL